LQRLRHTEAKWGGGKCLTKINKRDKMCGGWCEKKQKGKKKKKVESKTRKKSSFVREKEISEHRGTPVGTKTQKSERKTTKRGGKREIVDSKGAKRGPPRLFTKARDGPGDKNSTFV